MTRESKQSRKIERAQTEPEVEMTELLDIIEQDTENIISLRMRAERAVSKHQRLIEKITANLGRPRTFYFILCAAALWIMFNLADERLGGPYIDPPQFIWLQGTVSFVALLSTICVLITQNRQGKVEEQHNHLNLELTLLIERKVSKLIALLEELRQDLPSVADRHDPQAEAMKENANPETVLSSFHNELEAAIHDELYKEGDS